MELIGINWLMFCGNLGGFLFVISAFVWASMSASKRYVVRERATPIMLVLAGAGAVLLSLASAGVWQ